MCEYSALIIAAKFLMLCVEKLLVFFAALIGVDKVDNNAGGSSVMRHAYKVLAEKESVPVK